MAGNWPMADCYLDCYFELWRFVGTLLHIYIITYVIGINNRY